LLGARLIVSCCRAARWCGAEAQPGGECGDGQIAGVQPAAHRRDVVLGGQWADPPCRSDRCSLGRAVLHDQQGASARPAAAGSPGVATERAEHATGGDQHSVPMSADRATKFAYSGLPVVVSAAWAVADDRGESAFLVVLVPLGLFALHAPCPPGGCWRWVGLLIGPAAGYLNMVFTTNEAACMSRHDVNHSPGGPLKGLPDGRLGGSSCGATFGLAGYCHVAIGNDCRCLVGIGCRKSPV
jgi:hypothetical protein